MEITKKDFEKYEDVRASGITNMFMVSVVCDMSGLTKEQVIYIMKHYDELNKKYPGVRK